MDIPESVSAIPVLAQLAEEGDDLVIISIDTRKSLREFLAGALSYMPGWMRFFYRVRKHFVRLLGVSQENIPQQEKLRPEKISFAPGDMESFFTITAAQDPVYWMAMAQDSTIAGYLGAVAEPLENGINRIHLITIARYKCLAGRLYYNAILPFHHVIVRLMLKNGK